MPQQLKSAAKRERTSKKSHDLNRIFKGRVHTLTRKFLDSVAGNDKSKSEAQYRLLCSALDKAVKRGALKLNNASRHKSRAWAKLNKLS